MAISAANEFCTRMFRNHLREIGLIEKWRKGGYA